MKGSLNYIVSTDTPYQNSKKVGDKELIINTEITERDAQFVSRVGRVLGTPILESDPYIKKGDLVIVHHNTFRVWYDMRGELKNSSNFIGEGLYKIDKDQIFGYKSPGDEWKALDGFSFVKPIANYDEWEIGSERALKGELYFEGNGSKQLGLSKGDIVGFTPESEYEFVIDGVRLYRVYTSQLNILFYGSEKTTEA